MHPVIMSSLPAECKDIPAGNGAAACFWRIVYPVNTLHAYPNCTNAGATPCNPVVMLRTRLSPNKITLRRPVAARPHII